MTKTLVLALIVNSLISIAAHGASFDCNRARGFAEKTVCSDKELSELDDSLDNSYRTAIEDADQPSQVKNDQKIWLTKVRAACKTADCLINSYKQRIECLATVEQFYRKTYSDKDIGIEFIHLSNRTIRRDEIIGFAMRNGNYIIKFELGDGGFANVIEQIGVFEEGENGEFIANGRFENKLPEKISDAGWNWIKQSSHALQQTQKVIFMPLAVSVFGLY